MRHLGTTFVFAFLVACQSAAPVTETPIPVEQHTETTAATMMAITPEPKITANAVVIEPSQERAAIEREPLILLDHPEKRGSRDFVFVAVGDVSQPATQWVEQVEGLGPKAFDPTRHLLTGELNFMNLENPVTEESPTAKKQYSFTCPPHRLDWYLGAGFNMFSLANNHIADAAQPGIDATITNLDEAAARAQKPLWHAGAGQTPEEGIAPKIVEVPGKDLKMAFFSVGFSGSPNVGKFYDETLPDRIREAKKTVDLVMVAVHAGKEYIHVPDPQLQARYRSWVDAGADLVVGHHPHVIQPVEAYKGSLILYSLGNYVFASRTVRHRKVGAKLYGMIARVAIVDGKVRAAQLVPTWVNNSDDWTLDDGQTLPHAAFAPKVLTGSFADAWFQDMETWTRSANTTPIERQGDTGVIRLPKSQTDVAWR